MSLNVNQHVDKILRSALAKDPHRQILMKMARETGPDGTFVVATDTHRLVALQQGTDKAEPSQVLFDPDENVEAQGFPNWRKVIPENPTRLVLLPYDDFREAIAFMVLPTKGSANRTRLAFSDGLCTLGTNSSGSVHASVTVRSDIRPKSLKSAGFEIAFNCRYLLDALPLISKRPGPKGHDTNPTHVLFSMTENTRPVIITYCNAQGDPADAEWGRLRVIVMPMELC